MTLRPKLFLEFFAVAVSVSGCTAVAQVQNSTAASSAITSGTAVAPLAASAATAVPALVPYSGFAVDRDGHALSGETGITFLIYKDQTGGEPLFTETQIAVPDSAGRYMVRLGASKSSGIPLDLFSSGEARWLEIQISGEPTQPRTLLTSVPYALKAADATTLGGLPASAFMLAGTPVSSSKTSGPVTPAVTNTAVTTTGGAANYLSKFSGASTIVNSIVYDNGTDVGIGIVPAANTKLDLNGSMIARGNVALFDTGVATATTDFPSFGVQFLAGAYNSTKKAVVNPFFTLQSEPTGNNGSLPAATLNVLYSSATGTAATETGLHINSNGTINFAKGQAFPAATGTGSPVCIATNNGFGSGGTTFVAPSFAIPVGGGCASWAGFTKTASTVVLTTSGNACLSTDAKQLTVSVSSADPNYLGAGTVAPDYIQLNRTTTSGLFPSGTDQGEFSGSAKQIACTSTLLQLNENND